MRLFKVTVAAAAIFASTQSIAAGFVTIGTGGQTGVYYAVGQSVCRLVMRDKKSHVGCNAPSTGGSIDNLNAIAAGQRQMGVVQSDIQYRTYNGEGEFKNKRNEKLRSVFAIHQELLTIVARHEENIKEFKDLIGKRINIGNPGSGTRTTMEMVIKNLGLNKNSFAMTTELQPSEMASALCDNNLDAISYVVGHPSGAIQEAAASCDSNLVNVRGPKIDEIIAKRPYFTKSTIKGGTYKGTPDDVETFGVSAVLVTSEDVPENEVYAVTKAVFDNFSRFKKLHPAFAELKPEDMIKNAQSSPIHKGAIRYYKEKGWLK